MSVLRRVVRRWLRPTKLYSFNYGGGPILFDEPLDSMSVSEEKEESRVFESMLRKGMTVVDIGAHLGYYTLIAAKGVGKTGRVYAFEPNQANYRILVRNVKLNGYDNVVTVKKAVSNMNGKVKFYIDAAGSDTSSTTKSIIKATKDEVTVDPLLWMSSSHMVQSLT